MIRAGLHASVGLLAVLAAYLAVLAAPAGAGATGGTGGGRARFRIPAGADQVVVVSSPSSDPAPPGYPATLSAYDRAGRGSAWRRVFGPWRAETGYGHLRLDRREGDGSTPTGVFAVGPIMYGNQPRPGGLRYRYHRLVCGDWWDEDPYSPRYNRFVHVPCGVTPGFASRSEALWTETVAYPYLAVLQFNTAPVVSGANAPGSGIFLHSWVGGATAGCVALSERELLDVLRWLEPSSHPVVEIATDRELDRGPGL